MATSVCLSLLSTLGASVTLGARGAVRQQSLARFDGLRVCSALRQRAGLFRLSVAPRSLTISAAADPGTLTTVQKIIAKQLALEGDKVLPDSKFSDLGADSLDTVEIMMAIEEEFDVTLEEDGAEKVSTVQEAADMIYEVIKRKG